MKKVWIIVLIVGVWACSKHRPKSTKHQFYISYNQDGVEKDSLMYFGITNTKKKQLNIYEEFKLYLGVIDIATYRLYIKGTKVEGVYKNFYLNGKIKGWGDKSRIVGDVIVHKPEGLFEGTFEIKQL